MIAVFFFGLLALVQGQSTEVQPCLYQGNANHLPLNSYIVGCQTPPCLIPQLENVELQLIFKAPRQILTMKTEAHAYVFGPVGVNYNLGDEAITCNFLTNTYCPLLNTEVVEYRLRMFVESWMLAGTSVTVEFVVKDNADDSVVICLRVPIRVTPPNTQLMNSNNTLADAVQQ